MSNQQKLQELLATRTQANANLEDAHYNIRAGRAIAISAAQAALPGLEAEVLAAWVPTDTVGVFARGDTSKIAEVGALLAENNGCYADVDAFWDVVVDSVESSYAEHRGFGVVQHQLMLQGLAERSLKLDVERFRVPDFQEAACPTRQDTATYIRRRAREAFGDEVLLRFLKAAILEGVVNQEESGKLPVLIKGLLPIEQPAATSLFSRHNTVTFAPDFEVTYDTVVKVFQKPKEEK